MDDRERGLEFLRKHASNAPDAPTSRVPGSKSRDVVRAVIGGIGPVLKTEFDALRRENETLKVENERLRGELKAECATLRAAIGSLRVEFADAMADVDPARRYSASATARLLS